MSRVRRNSGPALALLPALAVVGVFFLWPVAAIIVRGLVTPGPTLGDALTGVRAGHLVWFTLWQAAASTALTVALGLPLAWLSARARYRGQRAMRVLVTVPFVLPTVVVGVAFREVFAADGPLGFLGLSETVWVILLAHAYFNVAVVARLVGGVWAGMDPRTEEAARTLGAGPVRAFLTASLPVLAPAIASSAVVVFLFCATSFGIVLIVGGTRFSTVETEIYQQVVGAFDLPTASVLALVQVLIVIAVVVLSQVLRARVAAPPAKWLQHRRIRNGPRTWLAITAGAAITVGLLILPILSLVWRSLHPDPSGAAGLDAYRALTAASGGVVPLKALQMSLVTALQAGALALVLGVLAAVAVTRLRGPLGRFADAVLMLPLGVSAVTLGFGYLVATAALPLSWRSSGVWLPIVQGLVALPIVVRVVAPALGAVDPRLRQAAAVLGASPARVFLTVDVPTVLRPLGVAACFALVITLGEFGAAGFLVRPESMTLPVLVAQVMSRPGWGNAALAAACSVLLVMATVAIVAVMEAVRRDDPAQAEF
ncbi:iron ABC transporter permease [Tsukamurella sp. 8F]|uniref:ABC transporter permease n=1 Tax=unclassified Tsukamurella TaxID=2633480 RepID=UPI0023B91429|nr:MULTISPECIES: iron ABC transporter permease [unclassified Tsukamurella]MDF0530086.1 iron ABC transporter permease [Tsukamurella sp. 8J]MDF0586404.1 iron ABC transporter permease [Tsukamurella sp. 8F]